MTSLSREPRLLVPGALGAGLGVSLGRMASQVGSMPGDRIGGTRKNEYCSAANLPIVPVSATSASKTGHSCRYVADVCGKLNTFTLPRFSPNVTHTSQGARVAISGKKYRP